MTIFSPTSASAARADASGSTSTPTFTPVAASPIQTVDFSGGAPRLGNPLDHLPAPARDKFLRLRDSADDAYAPTRPAREAMDQWRDRLQELQRHLAHQEAAPPRYQNISEIEHLTGEIAAAHEELARHKRRYDAAVEKWKPLKATVAALTEYVQFRTGFSAAEPIDLSDMTPNQAVAALEAQREEIKALELEKKDIRSRPNPSAYAREKACEFVDQFAKNGEPLINLALETNQDISLAGCYERRPEALNVLAFVMWACRDEIVAKLDSVISERAEDDVALTALERRQKLAEIEDAILQAERREEAILELALVSGAQIERRTEADVRAVLGIIGPSPRA